MFKIPHVKENLFKVIFEKSRNRQFGGFCNLKKPKQAVLGLAEIPPILTLGNIPGFALAA